MSTEADGSAKSTGDTVAGYVSKIGECMIKGSKFSKYWADFDKVFGNKGPRPFDIELVRLFAGDDCPCECFQLFHNLGIFALGVNKPIIAGVGVDERPAAAVLLAELPSRRELVDKLFLEFVETFIAPVTDGAFPVKGVTVPKPFLDGDRLRRLLFRLRTLEDIIILTKCELGGKFYRDHLLHTIRVTLLASVLASALNFPNEKVKAALVAGLFHDLGYSIATAQSVTSTLASALNECYVRFNLTPGKVFATANLRSDLKRIFGHEKLVELLLEKAKQMNHAIIGALEFLALFDVNDYPKWLKETAQAIAIHDPDIETSVSFTEYPLAFTLIIADELQEWGRPIGSCPTVALDRLTDIHFSDKKIAATFDFTELGKQKAIEPAFAPLMQFPSKQKNLSRLKFDGSAPMLELKFKLPSYNLEIAHIAKFMSTIDVFVGELRDNFKVSDGLRQLWHETSNAISKSRLREAAIFSNWTTREFVFFEKQSLPLVITTTTVDSQMSWTNQVELIRNKFEQLWSPEVVGKPIEALRTRLRRQIQVKAAKEGEAQDIDSLAASGIAFFRMFLRGFLGSPPWLPLSNTVTEMDTGEVKNLIETNALLQMEMRDQVEGHPFLIGRQAEIAIKWVSDIKLLSMI